mgnify:CR=1 FL=1
MASKKEIEDIKVTDAYDPYGGNNSSEENKFGIMINGEHLRGFEVCRIKGITQEQLEDQQKEYGYRLKHFVDVIDGEEVDVRDLQFTKKEDAEDFVSLLK